MVSVFPNSLRNLHTVKSWEFMGLEKEDTVTPQSIWKPANYGQDVIIANLDTGYFQPLSLSLSLLSLSLPLSLPLSLSPFLVQSIEYLNVDFFFSFFLRERIHRLP